MQVRRPRATLPPMAEARIAPSAARNREPLIATLRSRLPSPGLVLEIASGTGEHALWFAEAFPETDWQPTDTDPEACASIAAWRDTARPPNLRPPALLDAASPATWPIAHADAVLAINMVHIAPWRAALGLFEGAARILPPGGPLILYGPFRVNGAHTGPGNEAFHADLRARNPDWGIRDLHDLAALAARHRLRLHERIPMPADNLTVVFRA